VLNQINVRNLRGVKLPLVKRGLIVEKVKIKEKI